MRRGVTLALLALFLLGGLLSCWPHGHDLLKGQDDCQVCRVHTTPALSVPPAISLAPAPIPQEKVHPRAAFLCAQQVPAAFLSRAPPLPL